MTSMQERAERIGASLTIVTAPQVRHRSRARLGAAVILDSDTGRCSTLNPLRTRPSSERSVLVVDDHALLRTGVANIINQEPDLRVIAEASQWPSKRSTRSSATART